MTFSSTLRKLLECVKPEIQKRETLEALKTGIHAIICPYQASHGPLGTRRVKQRLHGGGIQEPDTWDHHCAFLWDHRCEFLFDRAWRLCHNYPIWIGIMRDRWLDHGRFPESTDSPKTTEDQRITSMNPDLWLTIHPTDDSVIGGNRKHTCSRRTGADAPTNKMNLHGGLVTIWLTYAPRWQRPIMFGNAKKIIMHFDYLSIFVLQTCPWEHWSVCKWKSLKAEL